MKDFNIIATKTGGYESSVYQKSHELILSVDSRRAVSQCLFVRPEEGGLFCRLA
jgi:hypothetical protein